jgi:hypothetical protein
VDCGAVFTPLVVVGEVARGCNDQHESESIGVGCGLPSPAGDDLQAGPRRPGWVQRL